MCSSSLVSKDQGCKGVFKVIPVVRGSAMTYNFLKNTYENNNPITLMRLLGFFLSGTTPASTEMSSHVA